MKRFAIAALLAAAVAVPAFGPAAHADQVEGCTVGPNSVCQYNAEFRGSFAAAGEWDLQVWENGVCDDGAPTKHYSWFDHDNVVLPIPNNETLLPAATYEGTVYPGECVLVSTGAGALVVGAASPATDVLHDLLNPPQA